MLATQWFFDRCVATANVVSDSVIAKIVDVTTQGGAELRLPMPVKPPKTPSPTEGSGHGHGGGHGELKRSASAHGRKSIWEATADPRDSLRVLVNVNELLAKRRAKDAANGTPSARQISHAPESWGGGGSASPDSGPLKLILAGDEDGAQLRRDWREQLEESPPSTVFAARYDDTKPTLASSSAASRIGNSIAASDGAYRIENERYTAVNHAPHTFEERVHHVNEAARHAAAHHHDTAAVGSSASSSAFDSVRAEHAIGGGDVELTSTSEANSSVGSTGSTSMHPPRNEHDGGRQSFAPSFIAPNRAPYPRGGERDSATDPLSSFHFPASAGGAASAAAGVGATGGSSGSVALMNPLRSLRVQSAAKPHRPQ